MSRVLVMMSGGVDSSVAAAVLKSDGHEVTGVTLKLWGGESDSGCCSAADVEDARRVAAQLAVPHYVFNFSDDFDTRVVTPYVESYASGETPNPCVECNRTMKFGRVLERARQLGFDEVATGHHARIVDTPEGRLIARGVDPAKDQSYVLYMLGADEIERTRLPIGEMTKAEVRRRARELGLRTAAKAESMDVCFITRGGRSAFLGARIARRPGAIVDVAGAVVGAHDGIDRFTVGQRRGTGVAAGERRYVVDLAAETATVVVGSREVLLRDTVQLRDLTFVRTPPTDVLVQTRAHGEPVPAVLSGNDVRFGSPQPRVAPGQVVACYDGDMLVGGGIAARVTDGASVETTERLQRAIDAGGRVVVPPGEHVVRTLRLRSGVTFEIPSGSMLRAHRNNHVFDPYEHAPYQTHADIETSDFAHAVLAGRDLEGVAIVGGGTIELGRTVRFGPKPIALRGCRDVRIEGITIRGAPNYCVSLGVCSDVVVARVTIRDALSDGIDPDSCQRVRIEECDIESDDDAICLKSSLFLGEPRPCEDIEILRCRTRSGTNGFKIGTETSGPVRRVHVADCVFDARPREGRDPRLADLHDLHEAGGVSIQTVDGADVEGVVVERVRIEHARGPFSIRRGARGRGQAEPRPGMLRDVVLRDVVAVGARETSSIVGVPGAPVQQVRLERVSVEALGGGRRMDAPVPECEDAYPQCTMFGPLPAWGLYARHVEGLRLEAFSCAAQRDDEREMIVLDDAIMSS